MKEDTCFLVFACYYILIILFNVEARGPHHPKGEPIKKHTHYRPTKEKSKKITEDIDLLHDKEHIQEHLSEIINEPDVSKMTDEELEFYYFQIHDSDKNSKLDGLEILQAILHTVHDHEKAEVKEEDGDISNPEDNKVDFEYYTELIDRVLLEDDLDKDGYLSYPEYVQTRKKAMLAEAKSQQPSITVI